MILRRKEMNARVSKTGEVLVEPLTHREHEILVLLAQGYSAPEIAQQLTLALSTVKWYVQQVYGKLGVNNKQRAILRAGELGLLATHSSIAHVQLSPKHNLPSQLTSFIGREKDVERIQHRLAGHRLVTLIGVGGIGKTRLSQQVANQLIDKYADGVWLVEFAALNDPILVPQSVATVLGIQQRADHNALVETLSHFLQTKTILLILDNCEHLLEACAGLADRLLRTCPHLKILATSREALGIIGEALYQVPSLTIPDIQQISPIEKLNTYESIRLFQERAQLVQMDFALTNDNAFSVTQICSRLDGIPLAIELAAVRVQTFSAEQIAEQLDQCFHVLTGGSRTALPKHQTLQASIDWSWHLLHDVEQILLRRLSVFAGGWTLDSAEAVCVGNGVESQDVLDLLTQLVNKSLVISEREQGQELRFSMLETIRAHALERLVESGEMEALRGRHAQYYGDLILNQASYGIFSANALHLQRELDNIRATLSWCVATPKDIELGARLVWVLQWFWYGRSYFSEGRLWTKQILASAFLPDGSKSRAMALAASGFLAVWQGEHEEGLVQIENSLAIAHQLRDEQMMPLLLMINAIAYISMGRDRTAQPLLRDALELFEQQNLPYFHIMTIVLLGNVQFGLGNLEEARALYEEAAIKARALGENWTLSFALSNLGEVARTEGQYDLAREYYEECEALLRDTGDTGDLARFVHNLGYIAQHEGDFTRAESQFRKSLTIFRRLGNRRGIAECLAGLAGLKARQGEAQWGATLLSAAESLIQSTGGAWWPADRVEVEANQEIISSALSESELTAAQKKGKGMTLDEALEFASERQTLP
jgi:predicted ATPase/DNA-binding CsgD family transcriptional regulator